jgi:heme exporter protein B
MSGIFASIVRRDLRLGWQQGMLAIPVAFVLLVATLFAFAIGPDRAVLARIAPGAIWTATLLAALLPIDRLIRPDHEAGVLAQYAVRGLATEQIAAAKWLAHWLGFGPAMLMAAIPALALLSGNVLAIGQLLLALALATAGLAALSLMVASLTAGFRSSAALSGMLLLPLAVPVLIFGAGAMNPIDGLAALKLLAAASLFLVAVSPFATGAALRGLHR